ncbi:MAG: hypothetical protein FJ333_10845, partial [Sphingomonadales bacterium]|nr:hypothetical protein [Sphingomonadales bacterium]
MREKINNLKIIINYKIYNKKNLHIVKNSHGIILVEFNKFFSVHPFFSLISNFLSEKYNYEIRAYDNFTLTTKEFSTSFLPKVKWQIGKKFNLKTWGIYRLFGVKEFIRPYKKNADKQTSKLINNILNNLKTKEDIHKIKYKGVLIGDLIYDGYLKLYNNFTIDLSDTRFRKYVKDFILLAKFWDNYFLNNDIKFIIGCHPYYAYGLILRISLLHNKITAYFIMSGKICHINKTKFFGDLHYLDYKFLFSKIPEQQKELAFIEAEKFLKARFSGKLGSIIKDIFSTRSAYHNNYIANEKVLKKNKKIKILVCTHQLGDCVYAYGPNLFPDFYEWLVFLNKISKCTDYDWYIKDHPPYDKLKVIKSFNRTYELTKNLFKNNLKFTYLNPNTSHHQIINEGIDFVLTIYGSVAFEYAYFDIPVLTATKNCSTAPYNFNIHSVSIQDYENKIKNLSKLNLKINKKEILEYFFMHQIYNDSDCLFDKYSSFLDDNNTWDNYDTLRFYEFWMQNIDYSKTNEMKKILNKFFDSKDYTLNLFHNPNRLNKI